MSFIEKCTDKGVRPGDKLKQFAFLGNIQEFLASLAAHAEGENGGSATIPRITAFCGITFPTPSIGWILRARSTLTPTAPLPANTGLLSRRFPGRDLLAYFEPYSGPGGMKWKFVCFCSSTNEARASSARR